MVSITTRMVYLWKCVLDVLFPHETERRVFFALSAAELRSRCYVIHHASHCTSLYRYKDPLIRASIHALKYKRDIAVADKYAPILAAYIQRTYPKPTHDIQHDIQIVPIPASKRRMRIHGFNQCTILCTAVMKLLPASYTHNPNLLTRTDTHDSQTKLSRDKRLRNVAQVFAVHATHTSTSPPHQTTLIIIDDVHTTGATMTAAIRACHDFGYREVYGITLAH